MSYGLNDMFYSFVWQFHLARNVMGAVGNLLGKVVLKTQPYINWFLQATTN